jgi:hypothetical protein
MTRNVYRDSPCGKGDNQRERQVSKEEWDKNWERTFRKGRTRADRPNKSNPPREKR